MNRRQFLQALAAAPLVTLPVLTAPGYGPPITGELLWSGGLSENKWVEGDTITFSYDVDADIEICDGPMLQGIRRIWADGACIYDKRPGEFRELSIEIDRWMKAYPGTLAQKNWPGIHYVELRKFPLSPFGNRVPVFAFETR